MDITRRRNACGVATLRRGELLGRALLPGHEGCTGRSGVVLYRIDDHALEEALVADPHLGAGLSALAAAQQAALEGSGGSSALAAGTQENPIRLVPRIRRLFGR